MNAFKPGLPITPANLSLPTMYDLPSENPEEPGLPDQFHDWQPQLLSQTFRPLAVPPDQVLTAADLNVYYDPNNPRYYKRPDWFAVLGVPRFVDGEGSVMSAGRRGVHRSSWSNCFHRTPSKKTRG